MDTGNPPNAPFDAGIVIDGDSGDWNQRSSLLTVVTLSDGSVMRTTYDEEYLYILLTTYLPPGSWKDVAFHSTSGGNVFDISNLSPQKSRQDHSSHSLFSSM
jgi:hypothetical protein